MSAKQAYLSDSTSSRSISKPYWSWLVGQIDRRERKPGHSTGKPSGPDRSPSGSQPLLTQRASDNALHVKIDPAGNRRPPSGNSHSGLNRALCASRALCRPQDYPQTSTQMAGPCCSRSPAERRFESRLAIHEADDGEIFRKAQTLTLVSRLRE